MKISVVIPCYNSSETIDQTLESIYAQTYREFDIVVVNDGSRDDTGRVLAKHRDRIKYVYQDNAGVSAARNTGVRAAEGDWIALCDADDLWASDKLEVVAEVIGREAFGCDLVFSDFSLMDEGKVSELRGMMSSKSTFGVFRDCGIGILDMFESHATLISRRGRTQEVGVHYGNILRWLILGNVLLPSAVIVKRSAYDSVNGFRPEFRNAEDTEFFLRLAKQCNFLYIDEPLITYRRAPTSLLATSMLKTMKGGISAVEVNCKEDLETYRNHKSLVDTSLARKYAKLGYFHLSEIDNKEAFDAARKALHLRKAEPLAWKVIFASMLPKWLLRLARTIIEARKR